MALISSAELTAALPSLTAAQIAEATVVISAAGQLMTSYCGTALESTTVDEIATVDPRTRRAFLRNKHVTAVSRVAMGPTGVVLVSNPSAAVSRASVRFDVAGDPPYTSASGLVLASRASGVDTTTTLAFATYPTLSQLSTAIGAVSGWSAVVIDSTTYGTYATADLDIDAGTRSARGNGATLWAYVNEVEDYEFDPAGVLVLKRLWGHNAGDGGDVRRPWGVRISYSAGYITIPDDLKWACILTCKSLYEGAFVSGRFQSEKSPEGYQYVLAARPLIVPEAARTILDSEYRNYSIL